MKRNVAIRLGGEGRIGAGSGAQPTAEQQAQAAADAQRRAAGELTRAQAMQLLDSARGELRPLPIHGRAAGQPQPLHHHKDW